MMNKDVYIHFSLLPLLQIIQFTHQNRLAAGAHKNCHTTPSVLRECRFVACRTGALRHQKGRGDTGKEFHPLPIQIPSAVCVCTMHASTDVS